MKKTTVAVQRVGLKYKLCQVLWGVILKIPPLFKGHVGEVLINYYEYLCGILAL